MYLRKSGLVVCGILVGLSITFASSVRSEVFGVPVSDDLVVGTLRLKSGVWARFRAREGRMVMAWETGQSEFFGFVPRVEGEPRRNVRIIPFKLTDLGDQRHQAEEIMNGTKLLKKGDSAEFDPKGFSVRITFSDITLGQFLNPIVEDPDSLTPEELKVLFGFKSGDFCCLTCAGTTVCADGVTMSCGSCFAGGGGGRPAV